MTCRMCPSERIKARGLCSSHYQSETLAGRIDQHPKAGRVAVVRAVRGRCPADHKHGRSHTCYNAHGCRCTPCRRAKAKHRGTYDRRSRELKGRDVWVPAIGSVRRLRALAVIGWSVQAVAERADLFPRSLGKVREGQRAEVHKSTHFAIRRVYEQLEDHPRTTREGLITRTRALALGWLPPAMWDDPDRDREPSPRMRGEAA